MVNRRHNSFRQQKLGFESKRQTLEQDGDSVKNRVERMKAQSNPRPKPSVKGFKKFFGRALGSLV